MDVLRIGTNGVLTDTPLQQCTMWLGVRLLVCSGMKLAMLSGDSASLLWENSLKALAPALAPRQP